VLDENRVFLNQQALVKVSSGRSPASAWGTTEKRSKVECGGLASRDYVIEVSAAGHCAERQDLYVMAAGEIPCSAGALETSSTHCPENVNGRYGTLIDPP
jgi:hypothetical protein